MTEPAAQIKRRVVLLPDLLGNSLADGPCRTVVVLWRNGEIQLVVNRWLLVRYLRLLGKLGLSAGVLRWWNWWLTASPNSIYFHENPVSLDPKTILIGLAVQGQAEAMVHGKSCSILEGMDPPTSLVCLSAANFLKSVDPGKSQETS